MEGGWDLMNHSGLHWSWDQMVDILQTIFWNESSGMKIVLFWFKILGNLFSRGPLTVIKLKFRTWFSAEQATSHHLNQWWPCLLKHELTKHKLYIEDLVHNCIIFFANALEILQSYTKPSVSYDYNVICMHVFLFLSLSTASYISYSSYHI